MTTFEETYEAVRDGVAKALSDVPSSRRMMQVEPFAGVDENDVPLRVVGVAEYDG